MRHALLVLAVLLWSALASAHTFPIERSGVLQVYTSHAELLLIYVEPPGPRVDRVLALYDQNNNGEIDGIEVRLATREFLRRAFYGLDIEFDAASKKQRPELRFKRDKDGGISVAILQRIDLIIPTNELKLSVKLAAGETIPPMTLIVEPVTWKTGDSADEQKFELAPGESAAVKLTRTPTPADGSAPPYNPPLPR